MSAMKPSEIRRRRLEANLSQSKLAEKVRVSPALVSRWERGRSEPADEENEKLREILGSGVQSDVNAFGEWVKRQREKSSWTVTELANKSGLSAPAIYKIEGGEISNPRQSTRDKIASALGVAIPNDVAEELSESSEIEGLGEMIDFDPHAESELPSAAGIYVLYDISERPIYVGQGSSAASRLKDHRSRFWYKDPIVRSGSFIEIKNKTLRLQIEKLLIRFLRRNAIINKQNVDDDER
jgi:transcriptional regulator with XRE-family HTH domain